MADPLRGWLEAFRREGDAAAMEKIVAATRGRLLAAARRIGARQDAEDSVQATYHALLRRAPAEAPVLPWLLVTVVRIAYRRKAIQARQAELSRRLARPAVAGPESVGAARREEDALVRRHVGELPPKYRDAIVLHHLQGLTVAETARLLGVPASTVATRLQRGRSLLRGRLARLWLAVAWWFVDAREALAGGFMRAKGVAAGVAVVVAVGVVGVGVGAQFGGESPSREREARPRHELASRIPSPAVAAGTGGAASASSSPPSSAAVPEPAADVHDPDAVARAVRGAYMSLERRAPDREARLAGLAAHGREGFRAVVALLAAPPGRGWYRELVKATWDAKFAGEEARLLDLAQDPDRDAKVRHRALHSLGMVDTVAVRDFLVRRVIEETEAAPFSYVAAALSDLAEPRACDELWRRVEDPVWSRQFTSILLGQAVECSGDGAADRLRRYLELPDLPTIQRAEAKRLLGLIETGGYTPGGGP